MHKTQVWNMLHKWNSGWLNNSLSLRFSKVRCELEIPPPPPPQGACKWRIEHKSILTTRYSVILYFNWSKEVKIALYISNLVRKHIYAFQRDQSWVELRLSLKGTKVISLHNIIIARNDKNSDPNLLFKLF